MSKGDLPQTDDFNSCMSSLAMMAPLDLVLGPAVQCAPLEVEELNILHHFFKIELRILKMSSYSRFIKGPTNIAEVLRK